MIVVVLRCVLAYVTFLRPVVYGAQLCKRGDPDPQQVTNITLALIFSWLLELADMVFLSSFIAARGLYTASRIVLSLYFSHPTFLGALQLYEKVFAHPVAVYGPTVDALVMQHVDAIGQHGLVHFSTSVGMSLFRVLVEVVDIGRRLMESTTDTEVAAAPLPRCLSQGHTTSLGVGVAGNEPVAERQHGEQYVTASVVARVRRTASSTGYTGHGSSPSSRSSTPPPLGEWGQRVPTRVLLPPPTHVPRLQRGAPGRPRPAPVEESTRELFDSFDQEELYGESPVLGSSTPPAVVRDRPRLRADYYEGDNFPDL